MDLDIATENVAGGLLDLQAGGRLVADIDPLGDRRRPRDPLRRACGTSSPASRSSTLDEMWKVEQRLRRLHDLGFDVGEMEVLADEDGQRLRFVPRVVESGYHQERLFALTGLWAGENQARRLLDDIRGFGAELQARTGATPPENIVAVRWLDQRFEPIIGAIPPSLIGKLQAAEIFHQLLEHRWFESRAPGPRRVAGGGAGRPTSPTSSPRPPTSTSSSSGRRRAVPRRPVGEPPVESIAISSRSSRAGRRRRRWRRR